MNALPGYEYGELIYDGRRTIVHRGTRLEDGLPVIIKGLRSEAERSFRSAPLQREYDLLKGVDSPSIVAVLSLFQHRHQWFLIREDFGGDSLDSSRLDLKKVLRLMIQVTEGLQILHENRIIHKDLKPGNIIYNESLGQGKLTDFSIASRFTIENPLVTNPSLLEGSLAYMSPEQTGRMNRSLDYRTDFYSLGATFYELLVGHPPFPVHDAMELVHCHLAKVPIPVHHLRPSIPVPVSDIVSKLLAKTAERRYQSANGLRADLQWCLDGVEGGELLPFELGEKDVFDRFQIPQKLYGRGFERGRLLSAFEETSRGRAKLMRVSGPPGIGKSSLVQELYRPITQTRGYYATGKFDQLARNVPYSAFCQAMGALMQQFLTEPEEELRKWRQRFEGVLGSNGAVIVEMIPEVELIIGPQPAVPELEAAEARHRFLQTVLGFVQTLSQLEHPLVLFLDDLQWADASTLQLIELLLTDMETGHLLLIGADRDNEVDDVHPWAVTLKRMEESGVECSHIGLGPLVEGEVTLLLSESLHKEEGEVRPLASLVLEKTRGNPFFVNQFCKALVERGCVSFDFSSQSWVWDLERIQGMALTDNAVQLMTERLSSMSAPTLRLLRRAACVGNRFSVSLLASLCGMGLLEATETLLPAAQEGLILPVSDLYLPGAEGVEEDEELSLLPAREYRFLHDRVQRACYELSSDEERKRAHLSVGRWMQQQLSSKERQEKICELVDHLNEGRELLGSREELVELAKLNLEAGKKAHQSAAFESAAHYFERGLALLGEEGWVEYYDLMLALHDEAAAASYLISQYQRTDELIQTIFERALRVEDKIRGFETMAFSLMSQARMLDAVELGLSALEELGFALEEEPPATLSLEELRNLPPMEELPYWALRILTFIMPPMYNSKPSLLPAASSFAVSLTHRYGLSEQSAYVYGWYSLLGGGFEAGKKALALAEMAETKKHKSKVLTLVYGHVSPAHEPLRSTFGPLEEAIQCGLDFGEPEFTCYASMHYCSHLLFASEPLDEVEQSYVRYTALIAKLKHAFQLNYIRIGHQFVLNLQGKSEQPTVLTGKVFDEEKMLTDFLATDNKQSAYVVYVLKGILCVLFGEWEQAFDCMTRAREQEAGAAGLFHIPLHRMYDSLIRLTLASGVQGDERESLLSVVEQNQRDLEHDWNATGENASQLKHKYLLVEGERARVSGDIELAMRLYDEAIECAKEGQSLHITALACELAARFWEGLGRERIMRLYLEDAYHHFVLWGADAKVREIVARAPWLEISKKGSTFEGVNINSSSSPKETQTAHIDFMSIIKASQTFSGEMMLSNLLRKLMQVVLEGAGADVGVCALKRESQFLVEAEVRGDVQRFLQAVPLESYQKTKLPQTLLQYVLRTRKPIVLDDVSGAHPFREDPYFRTSDAKSLLCMVLSYQAKVVGVLYLENTLLTHAFTAERTTLLQLLGTQIAISIQNAQLYKQNEHAREKAESANMAKTTFLANMSHELRTPLNAIIGYTEILQEDAEEEGSEEVIEDLSRILSAARHLLQLISEVLDLSKIEAERMEIHPTSFSLSALLDHIKPKAELMMQRQKNAFELVAPMDVGDIYTDEARLQQILLNLLSNAAKFTEGGRVTMRVARVGGWYSFEIEDTGIGIPPENLSEIFLPFQQLGVSSARKDGGTGLGLSIAERFCQMMGGHIQAKSHPGKGSLFTVFLPAQSSSSRSEHLEV